MRVKRSLVILPTIAGLAWALPVAGAAVQDLVHRPPGVPLGKGHKSGSLQTGSTKSPPIGIGLALPAVATSEAYRGTFAGENVTFTALPTLNSCSHVPPGGALGTCGGLTSVLPTVVIDGQAAAIQSVAQKISAVTLALVSSQFPDPHPHLVDPLSHDVERAGVSEVVLYGLLAREAHSQMTLDEARSQAQHALDNYRMDGANAPGIVPAGMTPEQYFLGDRAIRAYQSLGTIWGERRKIEGTGSAKARHQRLEAWFKSALDRHTVKITATFPFDARELPRALPVGG